MQQLPGALVASLSGLLGFDQNEFSQIHASGKQVTSVRINPNKVHRALSSFSFGEDLEKIPWTEFGYYLSSRPSFTFDPLFHAGCYYVQEASSMFLEQAFKQVIDLSQPLKVLDLCAAPGGKSTHIQSLISNESILVCNEVIRSRVNVLKDNIIKWGCNNVLVTNNDPSHFAKLENYFDVLVVDAPCSGSGLFRRDPEAIGEWSENNVDLCSQRQQRILADAWLALKHNGILIYSTCSYSKKEDEDICKWIQDDLLATVLSINIDADWGVDFSEGGYRFWPYKVKGEGFFLACFKKKDGGESVPGRFKAKPEPATNVDLNFIEQFVETKEKLFIKNKQTVYAWPEQMVTDFMFLLGQLKVIYSGTVCGELVKNKMIPSHALAMSNLLSKTIEEIEFSEEQSIKFLQRQEIQLPAKGVGWKLVTFKNYALGWINVLPNRVNNYYPKELRILKSNE